MISSISNCSIVLRRALPRGWARLSPAHCGAAAQNLSVLASTARQCQPGKLSEVRAKLAVTFTGSVPG